MKIKYKSLIKFILKFSQELFLLKTFKNKIFNLYEKKGMLQVHFTITCLVLYFAKFANGESQCTDFNPCKNLAECLRRDDDFTRVRCACKRGFNGNLCEICKSSYLSY